MVLSLDVCMYYGPEFLKEAAYCRIWCIVFIMLVHHASCMKTSNSTKHFMAKQAICYRKFILAGIRPANRKALGQITRSLKACRRCMLKSAVLFPALSQIMLFVDGMNGVVNHNETVQWLYTLSGSLVSDGNTKMHTTASVNRYGLQYRISYIRALLCI